MKRLIFTAVLIIVVVTGRDRLWRAPLIRNPFYRRPRKESEAEFLHQRDNWHHHYWQDKDGDWRVEYAEKRPDAR